MNNEERAKTVAIAIQAFAKASDLSEQEDGAMVVAADMMSNILHWIVSREGGGGYPNALLAVRKAIGYFVSEAYVEKDNLDNDGPYPEIGISIQCGEEVWATYTGIVIPTLPKRFEVPF